MARERGTGLGLAATTIACRSTSHIARFESLLQKYRGAASTRLCSRGVSVDRLPRRRSIGSQLLAICQGRHICAGDSQLHPGSAQRLPHRRSRQRRVPGNFQQRFRLLWRQQRRQFRQYRQRTNALDGICRFDCDNAAAAGGGCVFFTGFALSFNFHIRRRHRVVVRQEISAVD